MKFTETPTPREKAAMIETLIAALNLIDALPVHTPCSKCQYGENSCGKFCELYEQDVPTDYQPKGCHNWIEQIPF
jgi:hypothetical protein